MKHKNKILIATGGTGGHVFPAYSLAQHFLSKKIIVKIITDKRGLKYLKNYKDIKLKVITSATIFNKNPLLLALSLFKIFTACTSSLIFLIKFKPKIVFGMGGYASFPVCIAAKLLAIPFIIYENNLLLGKANKYLLSISYKAFVSYQELEGITEKNKTKITEVGNIIRKDILNFSQNKNNLKDNRLNLLILGGSQAAKSFAEKLPKILKKCKENNIKIKIFQQCLLSQKIDLENTYRLLNIECEIFNFSYDLIKYFAKTNLAITRSGSSMLAELLNCNIPIISVPLPSSADNHQLKNAKFFEKKGYGFLVEEREIEEKLFLLIKSIHEDKDLLNKMRKIQNKYSDKKTLKKIDKEIKELIDV